MRPNAEQIHMYLTQQGKTNLQKTSEYLPTECCNFFYVLRKSCEKTTNRAGGKTKYYK